MGHLLALSAVLLGMDVGAETAGVRARYSEITKLVTTGTAKEVRLYAPDDPASNEWAIVGPKASSRRSFEESDFRARVYIYQSRVVEVILETHSGSGDWTLEESYYFYPDCATAFYLASLLTFQGYDVERQRELPPGPYVVERRRYFDEKGREFRTLQKAFVQSTQAEIPARTLRLNIPEEAYRSCSALPFGKQLAKLLK